MGPESSAELKVLDESKLLQRRKSLRVHRKGFRGQSGCVPWMREAWYLPSLGGVQRRNPRM